MVASALSANLTREQQNCVEYSGANLLVRGEAGSGKSLVLLRRAMEKIEADPKSRVLIFTYNKTLAQFARELLKQAEAKTGKSYAGIKVENFHGWGWGALKEVGIRPKVLSDKKRQKEIVGGIVAAMKGTSKSKILERKAEFWLDEFAWLKGKLITSAEQYDTADRKGRGAGLRGPERRLVWDAFRRYQAELQKDKYLDFNDFAPELLNRLALFKPDQKVDWVMIDEAQDLQVAQVRLLNQIANRGITIAADEGQRIYKAHFTWKEVGIDIHGGNSKKLTTTFRSTKQIVSLAASLRQRDPGVAGENTVEYKLPQAEDAKPQLWATDSDLKEEEVVLSIIRTLHQEDPKATVGLLCREWHPLYRIRHALGEHKIPYEIVEGDKGNVTTAGVKLTTFHSAKGLEFDHVVLCRLNDDVIPGEQVEKAEEKEDAEELLAVERRLLYVSMTRARRRLYMTHGEKPSRLLWEMDQGLYDYWKAT